MNAEVAEDRRYIAAFAERTCAVDDPINERGGGSRRPDGQGWRNREAHWFFAVRPCLPHLSERGFVVTGVACDIEERCIQPVAEKLMPQVLQKRGLSRKAQAHSF